MIGARAAIVALAQFGLQGTTDPVWLFVPTAPVAVGPTLLYVTQYPDRTRRRAICHGIDATVSKVEMLVRSVSQFNEHSSLGFADRVALDLRLSEAESASRRVHGTVPRRVH